MGHTEFFSKPEDSSDTEKEIDKNFF